VRQRVACSHARSWCDLGGLFLQGAWLHCLLVLIMPMVAERCVVWSLCCTLVFDSCCIEFAVWCARSCAVVAAG
jgi:hypothetical protein